MKIGNFNISNLKLGTVQIKKVFSGLDLVWTSFLSIINDFKSRVLGNQGQFEGETCLNDTLENIGIDLFEQASLVVTPNGYKENVLYSVTPSPVGTNLFLYSEDFTQSVWGKSNYTIVSNTIISPNGTLTADTLRIGVDASSVRHRFYQSLTLQGVLIATYYLKKAEHNWVQLNFVTSPDVNDWANFDLENGVIGNKGVGAVASIEDVGDGWYRCRLEGTSGGSNTNCEIIATNNTNSGRYPPYQSTIAQDVCYVWGAQLEYGATAGPYIPTTTRQAINETICDFTVTRATTGTRVNSDGLIENVPYNLLSYSEEFNNGYWFKNLGTVTLNDTIAPNGTMTADLFTKTGAVNTVATVARTTTVYSTIGIHTLSVYIKPKVGNVVLLRMDSNNTANFSFNFTTKTFTNTGANVISSSYEELANGWFGIICTSNVISTTWGIDVCNLFSNPTGDAMWIWGAQLVPGAQPKDYFPTTNRFNIPRLDYSNGCPSILVEPQMTNSWTNNNVTTGYTTNTNAIKGATISNAFGEGFDGFEYNFIGGASFIASSTNIRVFDTRNLPVQRLCLYVKAPSSNFFGIQYTNVGQVIYKFSTLEVSNSTIGAIKKINNDTYALYIHTDTAVTGQFSQVRVAFVTSLTNDDNIDGSAILGLAYYQGAATGTVGLQNYNYTPIITGAGAVTRNADVISNVNAIDLIGQTEGTIFVDYNKVLANDTARNIISLNDGSIANMIEIWDGVGSGNLGRIIYTYFTNNIIKSSGLGQSTASPSGRYKICVTYLITPALVNFKIFINGVKLDDRNFTYTAFSNPLSRINIGNRNGIGVGVGSHNLDFILKTQITDEQAINLTTL